MGPYGWIQKCKREQLRLLKHKLNQYIYIIQIVIYILSIIKSASSFIYLPPVILFYIYIYHSYFIKNKLPYIKSLISSLSLENKKYKFFNDLKFIFPLFYEDFVDHILEEEKYIFSYIQKLYHLKDSNKSHAKMFFEMKKISLKNIAKEHLEEDSEMAGIRGLTSNYTYKNIENLHLKVIFQELEAFDKELNIHSEIENAILFPRALDLEKSVADKIRNISFLN